MIVHLKSYTVTLNQAIYYLMGIWRLVYLILDLKLLVDEESHITTAVAGTFGYLSPEYSEYMQSGRATEKTDVYSFGVLVLEIMSGKRPTDSSFIEKGLNIVGWLNFWLLRTIKER